MLWIREEEVFPRSDYGEAPERCREHDLDGICGDVCREDPEASPSLFCCYSCLVLFSTMASPPLDQPQEHLEA